MRDWETLLDCERTLGRAAGVLQRLWARESTCSPPRLWFMQCQSHCALKKLHYNVFSVSKVQGAKIIGKLEKNVDGDIATARDWCYYG